MFNRKRRRITCFVAVLLGSALATSPAMAEDRRHRSGHHNRHESRAHRSKGHVDVNIGYGHRFGRGVARRVPVSPGHYEKRWIPAVTETRYDDCGRPYTVVIREACYESVWVAPRYVTHYVHKRPRFTRSHHRPHGGHYGGIQVFGRFRF